MMNDGMLSQEEIDALLKVSAEDDDELDKKDTKVADYLTTIEVDTLGEIGNVSFGSSATTLSTLLNQKVSLTTPRVSVIKKTELYEEFTFKHVSIQVNYIEGFTGQNVFIIKAEDAAIISDVMLGGDGKSPSEELNEIHLSAVQEAMNQMMGSATASMSTVFDKCIDISPPTIKLVNAKAKKSEVESESIKNEEVFVKVSFQIKVGELIDSNIMQLIPIPFANELVDRLLYNPASEVDKEAAVTVEQMREPIAQESSEEEQPAKNKERSTQYIGNPIDQRSATVHQATFSDFDQVELNQNEQQNLNMLLDIPLNITVELGRTKRTIKDILDLSSGSIIELDKLAGEPVDILVNEKLIAQGEVVVIDENFGVRVTDIISQTDRIMKLK